MRLEAVPEQPWFQKLSAEQKELLQQSIFLLQDMQQHPRKFFDYSFIVMPAAKAYEGFIKDLLFRIGLISEKCYLGTRFRVGKSLNPELERIPRYHKEALYQELGQLYSDKQVPASLWQTWRVCRNEIFHYFPQKKKGVSLLVAWEKVERITETIKMVIEHPRHR